MEEAYTFFANLGEEVQDIPKNSIISKTLLTTDKVKVTLFGFDTGQELTEHTAASPAMMYFVRGEADLTLGGDFVTARAGSWVHMPARLPHSLLANTQVVMVLVLLVG